MWTRRVLCATFRLEEPTHTYVGQAILAHVDQPALALLDVIDRVPETWLGEALRILERISNLAPVALARRFAAHGDPGVRSTSPVSSNGPPTR